MTKPTARGKHLERAANLRASLIAFLNKTPDFVSVVQVREALGSKLEELKINDKVLASQLKNLADNNLILVKREGVRNLYGNENLVKAKTKVDVKIKPMKSGIVPAYKIDVVKGQKRVRITLDNVMFDIGVVDA